MRIGFVPLCDSAPLIVAKERGFFDEQGVSVTLSPEPSWANIRDKVAVGVLDAAQMLAPMVLSGRLGLGNVRVPLITALVLNRGGNAVTLGQPLLDRLQAGESPAAGLLRLVGEERAAGRPPLRFATVYPFSMHNYELRWWLAQAGMDPDRDVTIVVVPPPNMVSQLAADRIAGFCVGEPWNGLALAMGLGRPVVTGRQIWPGRMEKVLGVRQDWALANADAHAALLRSLLAACRWIDRAENRVETAEILARPGYLNAPLPVVRQALEDPDVLTFHSDATNFPWRSQGLWILSQMRRWGQLPGGLDWRSTVEEAFRTDLFRDAARSLGLFCPDQDYRLEGDGRFDPRSIADGVID